MSSLAWPAARSMRGTAEISRDPASTSRFTHSEIGGRESSMKPPSTDTGARSRTRETSSWNSLAPRGSRLPCPTMSSAGSPTPLTFFPLAASGRSLKLFLLEVQERVQRRGGDRGPALGAAVRHRRQPALDQTLLRLCGANEPYRQPDDERRPGVQLQQLEERCGRVPHDPDGAEARLSLREPEPRRGARYVQVLGEQRRALVRDEAECLARRDARGDHPHVRDDAGAPAQSSQAAFQGFLVQD